MSSARAGLLAGAAALALAAGACGGGDGPVGAPGGADGVQLLYVTPRVQVVSNETESRVTLALRVLRPGKDGEPEPWDGATVRARKEKGAGRLETDLATTDAAGAASFAISVPASSDRTQIEMIVQDDRRLHLPFDVVTTAVVPVDLERGTVDPDFQVPADGGLLRLDLSNGAEYVAIPYETDTDRPTAPYRFLYQDGHLDPRAVAFGAAPPMVPRRPEVVVEDRGHVVAGAIPSHGLVAAAGIPQALNVQSCEVDVDRSAPLRFLGQHVALYVDAPADRYQARIDSIGREFDENTYPTDSAIFGPTTDDDHNGVILIVMTPELNGRLGGVYCDALRTVGVEIFYAGWDPGQPIDWSWATLAHEHQHLINAGEFLRTRGGIGDDRWLNEGLSYAGEALNGYWRGALTRMWQFLVNENGGQPMLSLDYADSFVDNYMMFALYLGDRFGRGVYQRLESSGRRGQANVEYAAGLPFDVVVRDWMIASGIDALRAVDDNRYRYHSVDLDGMAAEIAPCGCVPVKRFSGMYLEPLDLDEPFDVYRSLNGIDADYYRISATGPGGTRDLYFDAFGSGAVHLALARIR